jgi:hypothetical protein
MAKDPTPFAMALVPQAIPEKDPEDPPPPPAVLSQRNCALAGVAKPQPTTRRPAAPHRESGRADPCPAVIA